MLLTVVMLNSDEATRRVVLLKRNSKYCKYFTLFFFFDFHINNLHAYAHTHRTQLGNVSHA